MPLREPCRNRSSAGRRGLAGRCRSPPASCAGAARAPASDACRWRSGHSGSLRLRPWIGGRAMISVMPLRNGTPPDPLLAGRFVGPVLDQLHHHLDLERPVWATRNIGWKDGTSTSSVRVEAAAPRHAWPPMRGAGRRYVLLLAWSGRWGRRTARPGTVSRPSLDLRPAQRPFGEEARRPRRRCRAGGRPASGRRGRRRYRRDRNRGRR